MGSNFGIDDGQLDDYSKLQCFILGFEFGQFMEKLTWQDPFSMQVHSPGIDRMTEACVVADRRVRHRLLHDDWAIIEVAEDGAEVFKEAGDG